jgi:hypothetical protein
MESFYPYQELLRVGSVFDSFLKVKMKLTTIISLLPFKFTLLLIHFPIQIYFTKIYLKSHFFNQIHENILRKLIDCQI